MPEHIYSLWKLMQILRIHFQLLMYLFLAIKKATDFTVLPMECQYLNKTALLTITGQQPQPLKHFALKRKPKSAALRAELLQKCKLKRSIMWCCITLGIHHPSCHFISLTVYCLVVACWFTEPFFPISVQIPMHVSRNKKWFTPKIFLIK